MKAVINGKVYNTETAEALCDGGSGGSCSDFHWWKEILYKTKKGAYFIYGEGGAMSSYSRSCGQNNQCGGSDIRVVEKEAALKFASEWDPDVAVKEFADMIEEA